VLKPAREDQPRPPMQSVYVSYASVSRAKLSEFSILERGHGRRFYHSPINRGEFAEAAQHVAGGDVLSVDRIRTSALRP